MEFDYLKAFYSHKHDETDLIKGINSLLHTYTNLQVKAFPCYIQKQFLDNLFQKQDNFRTLHRGENVSLFEYSFMTKSIINPEHIVGKFFIVSNENYENVYSIISLDSSKFFTRGLLSYFRKSYPKVSLTFITHKRLENLLVNFREKNYLKDFKIVRTSMKSRVEKNVFASVNWPQFTLEKAFEWVRDENGWFETLTIETKKEMSPKFKVSISREGILKTNMFFDSVYNDFIIPISKTVYQNVTFFGRRARLENNGEIRPLDIDYGFNLFESVEENKKFIDAMKKMKAASVSVIHGNPFVQLSIFDYYDGSSYDIWVLSEDNLIIVPQLKSSFQAIKRLINHIFDNYYEGEIKEHNTNRG